MVGTGKLEHRQGEVEPVLSVEFTSGRRYHYFEVPAHMWLRLLAAPSHGEFFAAWIRDKYRYANGDVPKDDWVQQGFRISRSAPLTAPSLGREVWGAGTDCVCWHPVVGVGDDPPSSCGSTDLPPGRAM
jgi:hypothetical protein